MASRTELIEMVKDLGGNATAKMSASRLKTKLRSRLEAVDPAQLTEAQKQMAVELGLLNAESDVARNSPVNEPPKDKEEKEVEKTKMGAKEEKRESKKTTPRKTVNGKSAFAQFGEIIRKMKKPMTRKEIWSALTEEGFVLHDYSVSNYVALAKKPKNSFGVVLVEEVGKNKEHLLKRV